MSINAVSVFTESLKGLPTEQTFALLKELGVTQVELGAGGNVETSHLNPAALLRPGAAMGQFRDLLAEYDLSVSALVCAANPIHPDKTIATAAHQAFLDTCRLAAALEVDTLVLHSGCAGDCASSKHPNFITSLRRDEDREVYTWQWERVLIPYWKSAVAIASSYGIRRLAFDLEHGEMVHSPTTLYRFREEVGSTVGAAFDPAHLIAQGISPNDALTRLGMLDTIFHVRASDMQFNAVDRAINGISDLDPPTSQLSPRALGRGHDAAFWREMMHTLSHFKYDRCISLRYEDADITAQDGLPLAVKALQKLLK